MRDCSTCKTQNRQCVFGDDWESCLTCKESKGGHCDGLLDLSQIVQSNIDIRTVESELTRLRPRLKADAELLTTLKSDVDAKQKTLGAAPANLNHVQSELRQLMLRGKSVFERHEKDKLAHNQLVQRLKKLRPHEENLFLELSSQVHHRTVNDCYECHTAGKVCTFSDESEQCIECQQSPRRRCQGSVDDDDTDRIKAALETVDSQIHEVLCHKIPDPKPYLSLKEQLENGKDAIGRYGNGSSLSLQEREDYSRLHSQLAKTRKELEELRNRSLIDDITYQALRIRRRILADCYSELLQRGVFYYDELSERTGYPERRGLKRAEYMDDDEFREAEEWTLEHRGELEELPPLVETQIDQDMDLENAYDSGIEL